MNQSNCFLIDLTSLGPYYDLIQLISIRIIKRIGFHSLLVISFNYLDSGVLPFTFNVEDVKRHSQSCSDGHYWFRPDLTLNTWGRLCPNIPGGFIYYDP